MSHPRHFKTSIIVLTIICIFSYSTSFLPDSIFTNLTKEDGLFEYTTAILFFITSILFLLLFRNGRYIKDVRIRNHLHSYAKRYFFLILAIIFFFGAGEEISWAQRIIGFETPKKMYEMNVQEEFNLHNIELFNIKNKEGVRKTGFATLFTMKQIFLGSFFLYLLVLPIVAKKFVWIPQVLKKLYIPVPPVWIGILFIMNYGLYRMFRMLQPWDLQWGLTEVQEFNFSLLLLTLPFVWIEFQGASSKHKLSIESITTSKEAINES